MAFTFKSLSIPEVILVEPAIFPDKRGFFLETFNASDFEKTNLPNHKDVHLFYKCINQYDSQADTGIRGNDPEIAVPWPQRDAHEPIGPPPVGPLPFYCRAKLF